MLRSIMHSPRYQSGGNVAICVWCQSEFASENSRARENGIFCTKKCEIEAKFWLLDRLREPAANAGESAEL